MPIFEFRCLECGKLFEKLFLNPQEEVVVECPACRSQSFERVISRTSYIMKGSPGARPKLTTRSCGPGSGCTTLEIPGPDD
jgi:putative FmdB family regulatory protein